MSDAEPAGEATEKAIEIEPSKDSAVTNQSTVSSNDMLQRKKKLLDDCTQQLQAIMQKCSQPSLPESRKRQYRDLISKIKAKMTLISNEIKAAMPKAPGVRKNSHFGAVPQRSWR